MKRWILLLIFGFWTCLTLRQTSARADALIINETPLELEIEPTLSLEPIRTLSVDPPSIYRYEAATQTGQGPKSLFLKAGPSGELAIDVPQLDHLTKEYKKRKTKRYSAQRFMYKDLDPASVTKDQLGFRLAQHTLQEAIQEQSGAPPKDATTFQPGVKSGPAVLGVGTNLPWFKTAGLDHELQVEMRAAQGTEALVYRGLADAALQYNNEQRAVGFEMKKNFWYGLDVIMSYSSSPVELRRQIKVSLNF